MTWAELYELKTLLSITTLFFGAASAVQAATYQATLAINDTAGAIQSLGADLFADMALITWTVDESDPPIQSCSTTSSVGNTLPYSSLTLEIGGVSWSRATPSSLDYVNVGDALDSGSSDYFASTTLSASMLCGKDNADSPSD